MINIDSMAIAETNKINVIWLMNCQTQLDNPGYALR